METARQLIFPSPGTPGEGGHAELFGCGDGLRGVEEVEFNPTQPGRQGFGGLESAKILQEMIDDAIEFVEMSAAGVRGEVAIGLPERVAGGRRLRVGDVEICGGEMAGAERSMRAA